MSAPVRPRIIPISEGEFEYTIRTLDCCLNNKNNTLQFSKENLIYIKLQTNNCKLSEILDYIKTIYRRIKANFESDYKQALGNITAFQIERFLEKTHTILQNHFLKNKSTNGEEITNAIHIYNKYFNLYDFLRNTELNKSPGFYTIIESHSAPIAEPAHSHQEANPLYEDSDSKYDLEIKQAPKKSVGFESKITVRTNKNEYTLPVSFRENGEYQTKNVSFNYISNLISFQKHLDLLQSQSETKIRSPIARRATPINAESQRISDISLQMLNLQMEGDLDPENMVS